MECMEEQRLLLLDWKVWKDRVLKVTSHHSGLTTMLSLICLICFHFGTTSVLPPKEHRQNPKLFTRLIGKQSYWQACLPLPLFDRASMCPQTPAICLSEPLSQTTVSSSWTQHQFGGLFSKEEIRYMNTV